MNVARKMIFISIGCFACVGAKAQVNCATSTKLVCLVPYNTHAALQGNSSATSQTSIFSAPIGAQLSQLPLAASAPGAVILTIHGNPEAYDNLGPVLVDRPDSVGQGRLVLGFSAQQFNFNHLDGVGIGSVPLVYQQSQQGIVGQTYAQTVHASLKYNQYVLLATVGLPKKTDISVIVPITRVSIGVAAVNPFLYLVNAEGVTPGSVTGGYTPGSASGVGDLVVNIKHVLWSGGEAGRGSLAVGTALRFPTGDALNYLGSGAYGFNPYVLAAYKAKFSPHVKIGYQWNTDSVLLNITGTGPNQSLPGGLQSAVGADFGLSRHLTLSADILTNEFQNSPSISQVPFITTVSGAAALAGTGATTPSTPCAVASSTTSAQALGGFCTASIVNKTFTTANFSGGLKWKPFVKQDLILYGNVLIQMNDVGLRSDASPSGGISYNFGLPRNWSWLDRSPDHW